MYSTIIILTLVLGMGSLQGINPKGALAGGYEQDVRLSGLPENTDKISGFKGTKFRIGVPDSEGDDYALYGITSEEKGDNPCYVTVQTENVNNSSQKLELKKNLCGGKEKSKEMKASFNGKDYGKRSFVTGIRVCMNNKGTRVKGVQIQGQTISDEGTLGVLVREWQDKKSGGLSRQAPEKPKDERPHCNKNWKKWAICPSGKIATAAILHYEGGKEPRSLTGIGLECRIVSRPGSGAVRR